MQNLQNIKQEITNLLNRQFDIQTIKEHLTTKGYDAKEIETALIEIKNPREIKSKNHVTIKQGFRGFKFIVFGILTLFSFVLFNAYSDNKALKFFRIIFVIAAIAYGIFIATRPLKDKL